MNLKELDSYKLGDAVNFHKELNPALWYNDEMRPDVRKALLRIAADFQEFLGVKDLAVEDVRVSGSNAAYSYTPHSDIDLHLIVDFDQINNDEVYQELFNAKKFQYNQEHNIKVRGYDVELYVQDSKQPHASLGEYSVARDEWTRIPTKQRANLDDFATRQKYDKLRGLVMAALASKKLEMVEDVTDIIKRYRRAGLDKGGEFGPENLAFKMLRTQGYIGRLWKHRAELEDRELSLEHIESIVEAATHELELHQVLAEMKLSDFMPKKSHKQERAEESLAVDLLMSISTSTEYEIEDIMKAVDAAIASGKVRDRKSGMRAVLDILEKQ
jgi:hypothetical protein